MLRRRMDMRRVAQRVAPAPELDVLSHRRVYVEEVDGSTDTLTVSFIEAPDTMVPSVRYLNSYSPEAGEWADALVFGGAILVIGKSDAE
jgi:hypothetical protein